MPRSTRACRSATAIAEPLVIHGIGNKSERQDRVAELLRRVGLTPDAGIALSA